MEKIILFAIGIAAAAYVARKIWRNSKGDVDCGCSCCDQKGSCGGKVK